MKHFWMITLFIGLAQAQLSHAQMTFERLDVGDRTFTNCTLKVLNAAEGIVTFAAGGAKIKLADLPPDLQAEIHFSHDAAEALTARNIEAQRKKMEKMQADQATRQKMETSPDAPKKIRVVEVIANYNGLLRCNTSVGEVVLSELGGSVKKHFDDVARAKADVKKFEAMVRIPPTMSARPKTSGSKKGSSVRSTATMVNSAALSEAKKNLAEAKETLRSLEKDQQIIVAAKTGREYACLPIWKYVNQYFAEMK